MDGFVNYYGQNSKRTVYGNLPRDNYDISFDRLDSSTVFGIEYQDVDNRFQLPLHGRLRAFDIDNPVFILVALPNIPVYGNTQKAIPDEKPCWLQQNFALDDKFTSLPLAPDHDEHRCFDQFKNYLTETKSVSNDFFRRTTFPLGIHITN